MTLIHPQFLQKVYLHQVSIKVIAILLQLLSRLKIFLFLEFQSVINREELVDHNLMLEFQMMIFAFSANLLNFQLHQFFVYFRVKYRKIWEFLGIILNKCHNISDLRITMRFILRILPILGVKLLTHPGQPC